jgi:hypothetical protein
LEENQYQEKERLSRQYGMVKARVYGKMGMEGIKGIVSREFRAYINSIRKGDQEIKGAELWKCLSEIVLEQLQKSFN